MATKTERTVIQVGGVPQGKRAVGFDAVWWHPEALAFCWDRAFAPRRAHLRRRYGD